MHSPTAMAHIVALSGARGLAPTSRIPTDTSATPAAFSGGGISCTVSAAPIATNSGAEPRDSV